MLLIDGFEQFAGRASERPNQRDASEFDEGQHDAEGLLKDELGARLPWASVIDPVEHEAHLVEPEQPGQIGQDAGRKLHAGVRDGAGKECDVAVADGSGGRAEGRERLGGIDVRGQGTHECAVGRKILELVADDAAQARFERAARVEDAFDLRLHLLLGLLIKGGHDGVFRIEVVVGGAESHTGLRGDFTHGCGLEAALAEDAERGLKDAGTGCLGFGSRFFLHRNHWASGAATTVRRRKMASTSRLKRCTQPSINRNPPTLPLTI